MRLDKVEIFIGVIIDINDPENRGRIKVSSPGYFSEEKMGIDNLFWVSPFIGDYQSYKQPLKGTKVWVLHNVDNYMSYWYIPFFEMNTNTAKLVTNRDLDILISRVNGKGNNTQLYFNDGEGIVARTGKYNMQFDPGGNIYMNGAQSINIIGDDHIKMGKRDNKFQRAINGETMVDAVNELVKILQDTATMLQDNQYTVGVGNYLSKKMIEFTNKYNEENLQSKTIEMSE